MQRIRSRLLAAVLAAMLLALCGCDAEVSQETFRSSVRPEASSAASRQPSGASSETQPVQPEETSAEPTPALSATTPPESSPVASAREPVRMRGVWIATVLNIDFPSEKDDSEAQKAEFERILDNTLAWGLDTVLVQVRPMGDALYPSQYNPWSSFLTGVQGKDPGWDPLAYMVEAAHAKGVSFHVWLNPYRVTHTAAGFTAEDLAEESLAKQHPEWLIEHENMLYYDPAREEVKQHISQTVQELVDGYDIDGVHFDDYFYPTDYPLPEGAERDGVIDRERRAHVNDMLRRVHEICKAAGHEVVFGVSPFGIWKNASSDPAGSDTEGNESYYAMAADSVAWIREGLIDYIAPQLYWRIGHELADYTTLLDWWGQQVEGTDVSLIIGQGVYQDEIRAEITEELELNAANPQVSGSIFFSYSDIAENEQAAQAIQQFYTAQGA